MKLALILMIRNEEKIIKRCLEAVENVVDCFCVCDTGSNDKTVEIVEEFLKTRKGCLTTEPWKNFGHNRTVSFQNAQKYVRDTLKWNLTDTYGLLLDADMVFMAGNLRQQTLTEIGYNLVQINGGLEYNNCRLVRMDYDWKCVGVTHEYWDGPTVVIPREVCYINDRDDGGCKHDKFERDRRLLEQGIKDEPTNVRYMFYLAQTYKCLAMPKESIQMYKKRIAAGGWDEEVWYSHYMIGDIYLMIQNIPKFEYWMQKAYKYRPRRAEPLYKLVQYFRVIGDQYKAYHYLKLGRSIAYPSDSLFVEGHVYRGLFDYEASILDYYVHSDKTIGLRDSMVALLKTPEYIHNIISNIKFYTSSIASKQTLLNLPSPFGDVFTPSAISVCEYPYANIRYVNYRIQPDGSYTMPNGIVETRNAYVNLETNEFKVMNEPKYPFESHIRGLEDLRLSKYKDKHYFTATSYKQFIQDKISIVHGEYDAQNGEFLNYRGIQSPFNQECEKNWVCFPNTDTYLYSWHPLRIGKIIGNEFKTAIQYETPSFFSHVRGSAPPVRHGNKWLVLVHFVEYSTPRKYYHCFIELDSVFKPLRMSLPFYFRENRIEFCVSCIKKDDNTLACYTSLNDCSPARVEIPISSLQWIELSDLKRMENDTTIIRIPNDIKYYWNGREFCVCESGGPIERHVKKIIDDNKLNASAVFAFHDGFFSKEYTDIDFTKHSNLSEDYISKLESSVPAGKIPIICTPSTYGITKPNLLRLPYSDNTFQHGLETILSKYRIPTWNEKKPIVFWRGGPSGYEKDNRNIRKLVCNKLLNKSNTDVKFFSSVDTEGIISPELISKWMDISQQFDYKYMLAIDGNTQPSNHEFVFGTGSVPILIHRPGIDFWFKRFLRDRENCILSSVDTIESDIQWLLENDDKAQEIATNALNLSKVIFSSKFQKLYIESEIKRICNLNTCLKN